MADRIMICRAELQLLLAHKCGSDTLSILNRAHRKLIQPYLQVLSSAKVSTAAANVSMPFRAIEINFVRRQCPEFQGKQILRKVPMSKDVEATDMFSANDAFTSKFFKVLLLCSGVTFVNLEYVLIGVEQYQLSVSTECTSA